MRQRERERNTPAFAFLSSNLPPIAPSQSQLTEETAKCRVRPPSQYEQRQGRKDLNTNRMYYLGFGSDNAI